MAVGWYCVCGLRYQLAHGLVQSNLIIMNNLLAVKLVCKKGKDGEFSPALVVAACLDFGGGGMGGGSLRLYWCQGLALVVI